MTIASEAKLSLLTCDLKRSIMLLVSDPANLGFDFFENSHARCYSGKGEYCTCTTVAATAIAEDDDKRPADPMMTDSDRGNRQVWW